MKKLLPLILLVACADPNAELLAKYKNLEIDYNALNTQFEYVKRDHERTVCNKLGGRYTVLEECLAVDGKALVMPIKR